MPEAISNPTNRYMDHQSWIIAKILTDQQLDAKRDRDGSISDRYEFWEIERPQGTVFICLHTTTDAGQADRINLTIDLRDAEREPIGRAPSITYTNPGSSVLRPLICDYLDSIIGGWR